MRERYLDGLRGWAALVVMLGHTLIGMLWPHWAPAFRPTVIDGTFSVYVFFVLSGYVLSIGFFSTGRRMVVADLALRRYLRLTIPILVISSIAMVFMMAGWMRNVEAGQASGSTHWLSQFYAFPPSIADLLHFSLWRVYIDPSATTSYNSSLWTMPVEMQGSILVFAFLLLVGRSRALRVVGHVAFLGVTFCSSSSFFAMALGVALAEFSCTSSHVALRQSSWSPRLALILVIGAVLAAGLRREVNDIRLLSACSAAVIYAVLISSTLQRLLSTRLSQWLGKISFSLYLVHIVVICSLVSWLYLALGDGAGLSLAKSALVGFVCVVACLLSAALFFPVERLGVVAGRKFAAVILRASPAVIELPSGEGQSAG